MRSVISAHFWLVALVLAAAAVVSRPAAADDRQDCLHGSKDVAEAAIAACTRAIESGSYDGQGLSSLYHARGYTWFWTSLADRDDRALNDYNEAIRLEPNAVSSLLNRSQIYIQRRDYDRAIADVNRAFEGGLSDYGKRVGYRERGQAYQAKGDNDRAIVDYTNSLQLDADNYATLTLRGNAYFANGDLDRAIADYDQMIALNPDDSDAQSGRASAYLSRGDVRRAIADFGLGPVLLWLATLVLLAVIGWLCSRTGVYARRLPSGQSMIEVCEQQVVDMQQRNAALEKIALALEKHAAG